MDMDWISKWSAAFPSHPAVVEVGRGRVTSYAELDERVSRLAAVLQAQCGVRPGDRVAALMRDRRELVELCFACRRTGTVFVPLDVRLSEEHFGDLLRDCRPAVVVHEPRWAGACRAVEEGAFAARRISVGPAEGRGALPYALALSAAGEHDPVAVRAEDAATVLYAGVRRGNPRGVVLSRRQVELNADTMAERFALSIDDRGLALVPLSDAVGLHGMALPVLRSGGTVVVPRDRDTAQALRAIGSQGITAIVAGPPVYQRLMSAGLHHLRPERLRCLLVVGQPCPPALIDAYRKVGLRLRVGYALTEVGLGCFTFGPEERPHSVGKPVPGSLARVVGEDGGELPVGEVGELWLKGPHVSVGYWGRPEMFEKALGEDGWFRTGDRACRDEDGWYYVVGRSAAAAPKERAIESCAREQV